ncbi:hypothetical protein MHH60_13205 [Paenibacillus sp. FSL H7-0716]
MDTTSQCNEEKKYSTRVIGLIHQARYTDITDHFGQMLRPEHWLLLEYHAAEFLVMYYK